MQGFFENRGSWLQSNRRGSRRREGRQTWIGFTHQITCNLLRQKSLGRVSFSSLQACMYVCVQKVAWNTHYKVLLTVWAAQPHEFFWPGSARDQHPPEKCFSALSQLFQPLSLKCFCAWPQGHFSWAPKEACVPKIIHISHVWHRRGEEHRLSLGVE